MKKILILFGGNSYEHDISCLSAKTIVENIDYKKYNVTISGIDKNNNWYIFNDKIEKLNSNWLNSNITKIDNIILFLKQFDKVFPIIHGSPIEDGHLQGLFDIFNIPYVGCALESSIIGYDKELTKIICNIHGIKQIPYQIIKKGEPLKINIEYPIIIKPAKCGSSIGINIVKEEKYLKKYLKEAFKYDDKIVIESFVKGRELECAILEDKKLKVSPVGEIKSANTFYDYEAKYEKASELIIPAKIDNKLKKEIQETSLKVFKILNLKNLSRIDFLYDYHNKILYFNEVNTMPGFTSMSMYPLLFKEYGIEIKDLITKLIEN